MPVISRVKFARKNASSKVKTSGQLVPTSTSMITTSAVLHLTLVQLVLVQCIVTHPAA